MSQNKEAIEKLEELFRDVLYDTIGTDFKKRADNILALLRKEPEAGGFTKRIREYIAERPIDEPKGLVDDLLEACGIIDRLAAELKEYKDAE